MPPGAHELRRRLELCDGFVISSPEYNASMPGVLKNAIDWVSRFNPQPFNELDGLLNNAVIRCGSVRSSRNAAVQRVL